MRQEILSAGLFAKLLSAQSSIRRLFYLPDGELPDGQTRALVRETLGHFAWLTLLGTLLTFLLGLSASPALTALGVAFAAIILLMRWLAARLPDHVMAWTFLATTLAAAVLLARYVQTVQTVHMLLLALPLVFSTFVYGPRLGLAYGAGIGLIGALMARYEVNAGTSIHFNPYNQAWVLFELLLLLFLLAMGLRRYVAIAHRISSEAATRQARADGAAQVQARLEMALRAGRFGVWEFDPKNNRAVLDERALELLGLPAAPNEISGALWMERILESDRSTVLSQIQQWLIERGPLLLRYRVHDRQGAIRWLSVELGGAPTEPGTRIAGILADITDDMALRSNMQDALRRADQALDVAKGFFFELDLRSGHLVRDRQAAKLLGLAHEETARTHADLFALVPEPARLRALHRLDAVMLDGGSSFDLEVPVVVASGAIRYYRLLSQIERDSGGAPLRIYGMQMDVTESRQTRRDLERMTRRFELVAQAASLGLWQFDVKSKTITQTSFGVNLFNLPAQASNSLDLVLERIVADDRELTKAAFLRTLSGNGGFEITYRIANAGKIRWIRSAGLLERNEQGEGVRVAGVNWDITADIEAREQLSQANDHLGLALSAANASVWDYNSASDLVTWDERGKDLYGVDPNQGARRIDHIYEQDRARIDAQFRSLHSDPKVRSFVLEYRIDHPQRGLRWLRSIGRIERDTNPSHFRSVGIDIDVTAERTASDAIEQARQSAEAASHAKSAFLANMSHEIRTPMNAIIGMTSLSHRATSLPQASSYAAQAHAAARGLLTVLNDVLDFSKIEAGRLDIESIEFSIEEVLGSVLDIAAFGAAEKNLELLLDVSEQVLTRYHGDPARIGQILLNLTSNAIKFTELGFVRVNVKHSAQGGLRFEVIDTGPGVSYRDQEEIFEPFVQGDQSASRRFGGTGLGLSICRRLAELMKGQLGVSSQPGLGSTFWLELPPPVPALPPSAPALPQSVPAPVPRLSSPLPGLSPEVLVLHSVPTAGLCLAQQLLRQAVRCQLVDSVAALHARLAHARPHDRVVILLDWRLLPTDPTACLQDIRNRAPHPRTILLCNRLSNVAPNESALLMPPLPSQLRQYLLGASGPAWRPKSDYKIAEVDDPLALAALNPGALAGVDVLLVEDNYLNRALVLATLNETGANIRIAENGIEAVQAVQQKFPDVVLMDIRMPLLDGFQASAAIRALGPAGRDLPILAISADALEGDRDRSLRAGMNDHLTKPMDPVRLILALYRWTVARRTTNPAGPTTESWPATTGRTRAALDAGVAGFDGPCIDVEAGVRSCLDNPALFARGLRIFIDVYAPKARKTEAAQPDARDTDDPQFKRLVHNLHGSVRPLGMFPLARLAARLHAELQLRPEVDSSQRAQLLACLELTVAQATELLRNLPKDSGSDSGSDMASDLADDSKTSRPQSR